MKLIAFDLDDTLLRDDLSISDFTVAVMNRLHNEGHMIVPASGRAKERMLPFIKRIGCVSFYISCNGAEIWDARDNTIVSREVFTVEEGKRIAEFGNAHDCYAQTYSEGKFYYNVHSRYAEMYAASSLLKGEYVGDLTQFIKEPRSKILMMDEKEKIASMLKEAKLLFDGSANVTCSKPYFLEFNPVNASKGKAIEKLCKLTGFSIKDMICFGDSLNDLSMLQIANPGVAVSNARDDVKQLCGNICGSNMEDGVATWLEKKLCRQEEIS